MLKKNHKTWVNLKAISLQDLYINDMFMKVNDYLECTIVAIHGFTVYYNMACQNRILMVILYLTQTPTLSDKFKQIITN